MDIYAPHGARMIFSRQYFLQGGYIDSGFSFYVEELSVGETARTKKIPIRYCPHLWVEHREHASTDKLDWRTIYDHSRQTYRYLRRKYSFR